MKMNPAFVLTLASLSSTLSAQASTGSNAITCSIGAAFQALRAKGLPQKLYLKAAEIKSLTFKQGGSLFQAVFEDTSRKEALQKLITLDRGNLSLAVKGWVETPEGASVEINGSVSVSFTNHPELYGRKVGYSDCSLTSAQIFNQKTSIQILNLQAGRPKHRAGSFHH